MRQVGHVRRPLGERKPEAARHVTLVGHGEVVAVGLKEDIEVGCLVDNGADAAIE
jgi:hypothetical protein